MSLVFSATARVGDIFNGSERTQILSNATIMANKDIHFYTYSKEHCAFMSLINIDTILQFHGRLHGL